MMHKRLWISAAIIATVVFVSFALSVPRTRDVAEPLAMEAVEIPVPVVALQDSFKKGVRAISGSIEVQNACTTASAEASMMGDASSTPSIAIAITTVQGGGVCLQLPARATFQTEITAPADAPLIVTVNGQAASTTTP